MSKPIKGQRVLRVFMYRGKRPVGSFTFWDQASLTEAAQAKVHGETPPARKAWDSGQISGETFGRPEYGFTGYGPSLTREELLSPRGFALIVQRCQLRVCSKHKQLAQCTVCESNTHVN